MIIPHPQVGDILTDPSHTLRLRVVHREAEYCWLFDLNTGDGIFPVPKSNQQIENSFREQERIILTNDSPGTLQTKGNQAYAKKVIKRLAITPDEVGRLMTEEGRSAKYRELKESDPKLTYKTYLNYLRAYFKAGCAPDAIQSGNSNNGRKPVKSAATQGAAPITYSVAARACIEQALLLSHTEQNGPTSDLLEDATAKGKPRKRARPIKATRYRVNDATLIVFKHFYALLNGPGVRLANVYDKMCDEVFSVLDPLCVRYQLAQDVIPTLKQFKNWYHKITAFADKRHNQVSKKDFNTGERQLLGNEFSSVENVGRVGSGDATIWNVGLRDRVTREVIGPGVIFRIRCRKSGMLLGISISLECASWGHFAKAVANCYEDKVEFCAKYGILITSDDWPIKGLPARIEGDCGESDNTKANEACMRVGIAWKNITGGRPDLKGGVESDFNTLQVRMNGDTPGSLVERWQETTNRQWRVAAKLDADEFMAILLRHELDRMRTPRDMLQLPIEMVNDGVDSSPLSVWNWYVAKRGGGLRSVDTRRVSLSLMERATASITGHGVHFQGISYVEAGLISDDAFSKARRAGRDSATVIFDHSLVDNIFLVIPEGGVVHCQINLQIEHQRDFVGKSFREVKNYFFLDKKNKNYGQRQNRQRHLDMLSENRKVIARAEDISRNAPASQLPPATQLENLKAARENAKNAHSPGTALYAQPAFGPLPMLTDPITAAATPDNVVALKQSGPGACASRGISGLMKTVVHSRKVEGVDDAGD